MPGFPSNKHQGDPDSPRKIPPGIDTDMSLRELLQDNAFSKLKGRAKNLTVGDTWRLNGWSIPGSGEPPPNDDQVLNQLSMDEVKSIADALEVHLVNHGNNQGWKYTNPTYACGGCTGSCAVGIDDQSQG